MDANAATDTHDEAHGHVHIVPVKVLVGVFGALIFLTVVTVAITWVDLGKLNLVAALVIAAVKATLVALIFMHLRWDRPFHGTIFLAAIMFVMLFVILAMIDTLEYQPTRIPGYAPAVDQ